MCRRARMFSCICVCAGVHARSHASAYVQACTQVLMHMRMCRHARTLSCICICVGMHARSHASAYVQVCRHVVMHMRMCRCAGMFSCICVCAGVHACSHAYAYVQVCMYVLMVCTRMRWSTDMCRVRPYLKPTPHAPTPTHSPWLSLNMFFLRSMILMAPSSEREAMSPVWNQPSRSSTSSAFSCRGAGRPGQAPKRNTRGDGAGLSHHRG